MKTQGLIAAAVGMAAAWAAQSAYSEDKLPLMDRPQLGEIQKYKNMDALIDSVIFGNSDKAPEVSHAAKPQQAAGPVAAAKKAISKPGAEIITIVLTGDTGFSRNHSKVNGKGVYKYGRLQPFSEALSSIGADINGDINFSNIETVVTSRNDQKRDLKGQRGPFNFRSHPNALRALVKTGFNLFSLANNHSMDYGVGGLKDTMRHVRALKNVGLKGAAGIGMNREEAGRPVSLSVKGGKMAFSAIGIVTNNLGRHRAGLSRPGQIAYRFDNDFAESTSRLRETPASYRMLSIHYGVEGRVRTDDRQVREWRRKAVMRDGIDLVIGHHAHVVRGVERVGDRLIFYGLGNFLHHGTADMRGKGICRSYGLVARIHLLKTADGRIRARAVEAIPVTNMHIKTARYRDRSKSRTRIHALNYLGARLDNKADGARGVRFTPQRDGSGLFCFAGAAKDPGKIGALCRSWKPAPAIPARLRRAIASSCAR